MNKKSSEKQIESHLVKSCKVLGAKAIKLVSVNHNGIPDRLVLLPGGRLVFVELKGPGKKPRPLQEFQHRELRKLGFRVEVIDSMERVQEVLYDLQTTRLSAKRQAEDT